MKLELGWMVKDTVTGFEGMATHWAQGRSGVAQYCVQPKVKKDGTVPDAHMFDENQLVVTDKDTDVKATKPIPFSFDYDDEVENPTTQYRGKVVCKAVYLNGCVRYGLQPPVDTKTKTLPKETWFFQSELKLIKAAKKPEPKKEKEARRTGGPARSIPSFSSRV